MKMWPRSTQADFGKLGNNVVTLHCMCLKRKIKVTAARRFLGEIAA